MPTDSRITGSFPGGPRRPAEGDEPRRAPHIPTLREIEQAISRRTLLRAHARRGRRRLFGAVLVMTLGFAAGAALGLATHTTPEALTDAMDTERARDAEISREVNRLLLELWKMEDVEAARGSRQPR